MISLTLPWPPSVNHYWRIFRNRMIVSAAGRDYRKAVGVAVLEQQPAPLLGGARLEVSILAEPPDRRRRDLDNVLKAILDGIVSAGVIDDDSLVD